MNCKPGDLAVFVKAVRPENIGRIVRVERLATGDELEAAFWRRDIGPVWRIDRLIDTTHGGRWPLATDRNLRPIRDPGDDAQDETLQWLPVPSKEIA